MPWPGLFSPFVCFVRAELCGTLFSVSFMAFFKGRKEAGRGKRGIGKQKTKPENSEPERNVTDKIGKSRASR